MKKYLLIILIIVLSGNINNIFPWDSTAAKYLPLQVGNIWVYRTYKSGPTWICYAYEKYKIEGTIQLNNKTFYVVQKVTNLYNPICSVWVFPVASRLFRNTYLRIDTVTTNIMGIDSCVVDSLAANEGDSSKVCNYLYSPVVCDTSTQLIFGYSKPAKTFRAQNFETSEVMWYIKDFGFVRYHLHQPGPVDYDMLLTGCIINGVLYGDTNTLVGINQINSEVPYQYSLSQNYPNPFNPSTKIGFSIPLSRGVSEVRGVLTQLIVYDALGREVQTLVNENLSPGTYEVDFDGSILPSGVYFYKLESGNYVETKRMVLIK